MQQTPKPYLSSSQIELVFSNPAAYINRYIYNIKEEEVSPQQAFGKHITDIFEGRVKGDKKTLEQLKALKRPERTNVALRTVFKRIKEEVAVIGYLDGENGQGESLTQIELKTGVWKWDQKRANESEQLKLYAAIVWSNTGYIPPQELIWIPTKNEDGVITIAGSPVAFKVKHGTKTMLEAIRRVWKAYDVIVRLYEKFRE